MDRAALTRTVQGLWDDAVLPSLSDLVAVPAVSPAFDPEWAASGHLDAAVEHVRRWIAGRTLPNVTIEVIQLDGRTPLLLVDVPATDAAKEDAGTVLLYGHLDKQPPVGGWSEGLDPWKPVIRDGRLYGRGSVDDGYAGYAAIAAIEALRANGGAHARCVLLLETGEESGSPDLPAYLEHLADRLGRVSLVVCLDSGAGDYERMWLTTSLRGLVQVEVTAHVLDVGQHSGAASGVVPSSFRVLRALLDRVEDPVTGEIKLPEMTVEVPEDRMAELRATVDVTRGVLPRMFPLAQGVRPVADDDLELALNRTWRPTLSVIGADGLPAPADAGNVLRPWTTLCLSFRLPPTADAQAALEAVCRTLTTDVPYGARIELGRLEAGSGWNAPAVAPWLRGALDGISEDVFGQPWRTLGEGGSIPFMGLLHEAYPDAQFVVTGALGPGSNAHVPDESLHLEYAAKVTAGVAVILDAHARA
ncbi:Acetylornithine deacetylase/Succinyl-diaminopimelate desuccinylase [Streptoalloteichus tenebrarius]|uniref:Acetylornithine deacetylase/Succinyl-diaminopimelate desuccinylase n=1 Tax=Streptoalloteichus tenebrarius (strain ATCC 17920 / DSM 40477 / JCM 4838 / CBS 697.72 / NBRC 16177 / NCIMB 11028 / NRRL B-12390 / A12253. 1 / ISP 5477) TaxID=1933 RepID=A0ABT1I1Z9_STRSD|nr:M20/M25/M40 family metallo-hydrolase [Streptoalloteichus tenebrarius]MCP2261810.1 Acetylornithine deacetylase/Succinyl-diaminopimelate desuccinylase [Streptoalloteichus tenebrarius]